MVPGRIYEVTRTVVLTSYHEDYPDQVDIVWPGAMLVAVTDRLVLYNNQTWSSLNLGQGNVRWVRL